MHVQMHVMSSAQELPTESPSIGAPYLAKAREVGQSSSHPSPLRALCQTARLTVPDTRITLPLLAVVSRNLQ